MKVIDLLNKIANGEEVPEKIKWGIHIFEWYAYNYNEVQPSNGKYLEDYIDFDENYLTDEVEIIEENKKIEKLKFTGNGDTDYVSVIPKINEIIDKINEMEK